MRGPPPSLRAKRSNPGATAAALRSPGLLRRSAPRNDGGDARLNSLNDSLPEQALRADQKKRQRDHIGAPALDATAHQRPPVELAELLANADDEPADDCARNRGETAKDQ